MFGTFDLTIIKNGIYNVFFVIMNLLFKKKNPSNIYHRPASVMEAVELI